MDRPPEPSSIVFFVAVAIGIIIAIVFVFFSLRYYVRTRLGIYGNARLTSRNGALVLTNGGLQRLGMYSMNRQQRRRFLKKRRLTQEEVDHLFPLRTYQEWLDGGAEMDEHARGIAAELKEEDDDLLLDQQQHVTDVSREDTPSAADDTAASTTNDSALGTSQKSANVVAVHSDYNQAEITNPSARIPEIDLGTPTYEIHFDSGTCAICIDTFEPDDEVRGLICGHVFHQACLDPWLTKRKACCPMCKRDYYLKKNEDSDNTDNGDVRDDEPVAAGEDFTEFQYLTLQQRADEIERNNPVIGIAAKEKIKHFLRTRWKFFWFIMGVSRQDLINCAIVNEAERRINGLQQQEDQSPEEHRDGGADMENAINTNNDNDPNVQSTRGISPAGGMAQDRNRAEQMV
ncbi:unnamed protein product [Cyberlindnera jadinii]|uniref:RING-type domain-containing protein n=1 Tax=Cyberlindnera jadinii (strain ATCC 18201 / CBS 1600 / BCRC 20928 / JCM 3617 / NBRC 0987 / NRRL Y-1542) TaxID=983966 RepID=A0A0H5C3S1_CYBJN|nr:hypothetical protein CYBJADRAFT_166156 [Cyberlindnera jadinii NRRL Y-1542]ODV75422.1 hypothetical protein CYBJADRAFT_166156 [Cyberlindnera jadinii NRRL Y-1542]CEP22561.1 unnamed protein product [Cyberlindnera jadinii]